ncbi:hypothetical protein HAX54_022278 [Datura stramonium]|uniref:Uncharacterized protein n=1 Tax=Datura stramonium TaxID=4076 RepID=A0ABS8S477_DATST|nr:hypothetical protein [Datura stramonium]
MRRKLHTHVTSQGPGKVTNEIPHLEAHLLRNLDKNGIVTHSLPSKGAYRTGQTQQSNDRGTGSPLEGGQETTISRHITTYRQHRRDLGKQPDWVSEDP